jgi:hypothetical protein
MDPSDAPEEGRTRVPDPPTNIYCPIFPAPSEVVAVTDAIDVLPRTGPATSKVVAGLAVPIPTREFAKSKTKLDDPANAPALLY